jgi:hypothetical protein
MRLLYLGIIILLLTFPINIFMTTTWGYLAKDSEDPRTIEEFIDDKIQEHEDDSQAHAEAGESIAVHRENTVVDHPAGSILADKTTMNEVFILENWATLDAWTTSGDVQNGALGNIEMVIVSPSVLTSKLYTFPSVPYQFINWDYDMLYQTMFWFDDVTTTQQARFGYYLPASPTGNGFGFKIIDGVLHAHSKTTPDGEELTELDIDYDISHVYRTHYREEEGLINYYVDGNLLATHEVTPTGFFSGAGILAEVQGATGDEYTCFLGQSLFSRSLV